LKRYEEILTEMPSMDEKFVITRLPTTFGWPASEDQIDFSWPVLSELKSPEIMGLSLASITFKNSPHVVSSV